VDRGQEVQGDAKTGHQSGSGNSDNDDERGQELVTTMPGASDLNKPDSLNIHSKSPTIKQPLLCL
jgi:hypothetical protein